MNQKQYVLNREMFEMQGPKFEMKSVALSFAITLCTQCQEVLLAHVHQLEASGVQPGKLVNHFPVNAH